MQPNNQMPINRRAVVGVFDEPAMADVAIEELQRAGFSLQQICIASRYSEDMQKESKHTGSFLEGIKRLFVGDHSASDTDVAPIDVESELEGIGLSPDAARYYEERYRQGKSVVGVRAENRVQDALVILRSRGAYDFEGRPEQTGAAMQSQPPSSIQSVVTGQRAQQTTSPAQSGVTGQQTGQPAQSGVTGQQTGQPVSDTTMPPAKPIGEREAREYMGEGSSPETTPGVRTTGARQPQPVSSDPQALREVPEAGEPLAGTTEERQREAEYERERRMPPDNPLERDRER